MLLQTHSRHQVRIALLSLHISLIFFPCVSTICFSVLMHRKSRTHTENFDERCKIVSFYKLVLQTVNDAREL
jgi:hypothetical protein